MRRVAFLIVAACGAGTPTTAHIEPVQLPDAAVAEPSAPLDDAWHGEGCRTIASRDAPIVVEKIAVSGVLFEGRTNCYLDLVNPLCFEWGDAGAPEQIEVAQLRIAGGCAGMSGTDVDLRGKLDNPIVSVGVSHGYAIEIAPTSLQRVTVTVTIGELAEKPATLDDLRDRFARCWRDAKTGAKLTLLLRVTPDGRVDLVERPRGSAVASDAEVCVIDVVRHQAIFAAGAERHITFPVAFTRTLSPMK